MPWRAHRRYAARSGELDLITGTAESLNVNWISIVAHGSAIEVRHEVPVQMGHHPFLGPFARINS